MSGGSVTHSKKLEKTHSAWLTGSTTGANDSGP